MPTEPDSKIDTAEVIDRAARRLLDEERRAMVSHPEVDELVALQEGRLAAERAEALRAHLALCAECAEDFLELGIFDSATTAPATVADCTPEEEEGWQRFRQQLAEVRPSAPDADPLTPNPATTATATTSATSLTPRTPPASRRPPHSSPPRRHLGPRWMLAASVLFALSGLWGWWIALGPHDTRPGSSLGSPYDFTLRPAGEATIRSGASAHTVDVPDTTDALVPTLLLGDTTPHAHYRAEIRDTRGQVVFRADDLSRFEDGRFVLLIPRTRLPAGKYVLDLFGQRDGVEHRLASYSFVLRDSLRAAP